MVIVSERTGERFDARAVLAAFVALKSTEAEDVATWADRAMAQPWPTRYGCERHLVELCRDALLARRRAEPLPV